MDDLFRLIGLMLPDTWEMLRLKVIFGGICGLGAGLLFMATGLDGSLAWGGLMAACGIALIGIASRSIAREARRASAGRERPTSEARQRIRPATAWLRSLG
jgi:hypothetical protein